MKWFSQFVRKLAHKGFYTRYPVLFCLLYIEKAFWNSKILWTGLTFEIHTDLLSASFIHLSDSQRDKRDQEW